MAGGAFTNGPIEEPKLIVQQNFVTPNPLVAEAPLPVVVMAQHRQIEFEEVIGQYAGVTVVLPLASLTKYAAVLVELDPITYIDENGDTKLTPSLPNVVFRHPQFGDFTIPKDTLTVPGWSFNQTLGEFTIDGAFVAIYTILAGVGDYTAEIAVGLANAGDRTFTDIDVDFLGSGVQAGDVIVTANGRFTVVSVTNETTLIIRDIETTTATPAATGSDVSYTVEKSVDTGGDVVVTYVANRADQLTSLLTIDENNIDAVVGPVHYLNPLGYYCQRAIQNTGTQVLAVQVGDATDEASWQEALDTLTNFEQPYALVPTTQDRAVLTAIIAHVDLMSTPDEAKERRLIANYPLVIREIFAQNGAGFQPFGLTGTSSRHDTAAGAIFRVPAGQQNLHALGVTQGDVVRDLTPGFTGTARIVSIVPASAAPDADVTLVLATPNTWSLYGTQAARNLIPVAAQIVGAQIDASASLNTETVTLDGVLFTAAAVPVGAVQFLTGSNNSLKTVMAAYFGSRYTIDQAGAGLAVRVRETRGGFTIGAAISDTLTGFSWEFFGGGGAPVTLVVTGLSAGHKDGDTFVLQDQANVPTTFRFENDQTLANGILDTGAYVVQIGGPIMSAAEIRDRIIDSLNNGANTLALTASASATSPQVIITADVAGPGTGAFAAAGVIASVTAPLTMGANALGTGADGGSPITTWQVTTVDLTLDEQATAMAQLARDLNNRRVLNVFPDVCDEQFSDLSAGQALAQLGKGIFGGGTSIVDFVPNYSCSVAIGAARSGMPTASTPLTKRQIVGPYRLRRSSDTYTKAQLDRILSTGTIVMEQLVIPGGTVDPIRCVTTNVLDLKFAEENVNAAVDKFARTLRSSLRGVFGPNLIDPDGNFLEMVSTKVQAVIDDFTRPGNREARAITIIAVRESATQKDRIEMDIVFVPVFGANSGLFTIFV